MFFLRLSEFLAIAFDGLVADVQIFGEPTQRADAMLISEEEVGGVRDQNNTCYGLCAHHPQGKSSNF